MTLAVLNEAELEKLFAEKIHPFAGGLGRDAGFKDMLCMFWGNHCKFLKKLRLEFMNGS